MRPVEIALQLIELLGLHQPAGVTELAKLAKLPKSTTQRSLLALEKAGWVEVRDPGQPKWSLTIRAAVAAGRSATSDQLNLRSLAIPVMEELRRASEETIHLGYLFGNSLVVFERLDGIKPVKYFLPHGAVFGLHSTAQGKAILAKFSDAKFERYVSQPLTAFTPQTVTSPSLLRREIQKIRQQGYSVNVGGNFLDNTAIGAAICDAADNPFAAISISGPSPRMKPQSIKRWGLLIADAARRISIGAAALPGLRSQ